MSMDPSMLSNGFYGTDGESVPISPPGSAGSSPRSQRRASLTGEPSDAEMLQFWQEQALLPLKEDLAEWLVKVLDIDITADNFMSVLDSGVYICRLAKLIQTKEEEHAESEKTVENLPVRKIRYKENAKSGTWFARDNIANFLQWARDRGVKEECMFETEGLVSNREPKNVLLCLLELARIGHRYGIDPPGLVQLEKEIEMEEKGLRKESVSPKDSRSSSPRDSRPCTPRGTGIPRPTSASSARGRSASLSLERPLSGIATPRGRPNLKDGRRSSLIVANGKTPINIRTPMNGKTPINGRTPMNNGKTPMNNGRTPMNGKTPRANVKTPATGVKRKIDLDKEDGIQRKVRKITSDCKCSQCYKIERLSEGKYSVGGRILYVRLLKDKHVMVRVGGGWDTLEHYLATHDPCRTREVSRSTSLHSMPESSIDDRFLVIQGRYKHRT